MFSFGWMLFQAAIAAPVYFFCTDTLKGEGLAPGLMAMGVAFVATWIVTTLIDLPRRIRARRLRVSDQPSGQGRDVARIARRSGYSTKQIDAPRIGQDIRKLT